MRRWSWCASRTAWTRSSARTCPSAWPSTAQRAPSSARPWKGAPRTGWRAGLWRRRASRRSQLPSSTRKTTAAAVLLVGRQTACARAATCTDSRVRRTTRCATLRRRAAPSQRTWCCRCCLAWTATTSRAPTRRGRRASCTTPCAAAPCAADTKWREKGGGVGRGCYSPRFTTASASRRSFCPHSLAQLLRGTVIHSLENETFRMHRAAVAYLLEYRAVLYAFFDNGAIQGGGRGGEGGWGGGGALHLPSPFPPPSVLVCGGRQRRVRQQVPTLRHAGDARAGPQAVVRIGLSFCSPAERSE